MEEEKEKKLIKLEPVCGPDIYYAEILNPEGPNSELKRLLGMTEEEGGELQEKLFEQVKLSSSFDQLLVNIQPLIKHINHVYYISILLGYKIAKDKYEKPGQSLIEEMLKQKMQEQPAVPSPLVPSPTKKPHITIKPVKRGYSGSGATLSTEDVTEQPTF